MFYNFKNKRIIWTRNLFNRSLTPITWHLEQATMPLRRNYRRSKEELATPAIVSTARNEGVGRPRLALAQEQLETLHGEAGFRWADVARILGVSERTVRRRRLEFGLPVGRGVEFNVISDEELDSHVRHILRTTPSSGRRFVQGGLRNRGLRIQRRRIEESLRRVDPVICSLRAARHIIRRAYNSVPCPKALWYKFNVKVNLGGLKVSLVA